MQLTIFDTLAKKVIPLVIRSKTTFTIYTCGPTVYSRAHLGNLRPYLITDFIKRTLIDADIPVKNIINVTDIGHLDAQDQDKVLDAAQKAATTPAALAKKYYELFLNDLLATNTLMPDQFAWATTYIPTQIELTKKILAKGLGFETEKGVYLDVNAVKVQPEQLLATQTETKFALWRKNEKYQIDSPWGKGAPGWHIECLAIIQKNFSLPISMHIGGFDHIAIHHNNEIIQAAAVDIPKLADHWVHVNTVNYQNQKMSKSLGNCIYLDELLTKYQISPLQFKMMVIGVNFRQRIDLSDSWITERIHEHSAFLINLATSYAAGPQSELDQTQVEEIRSLARQFNSAALIKRIYQLAKTWSAYSTVAWTTKTFLGIDALTMIKPYILSESTLASLKDELEIRSNHQAKKDWRAADLIKAKLAAKGYHVIDTKHKTIVLKIN